MFRLFPFVTFFVSLLASIACFDCISRFGSLALLIVLFQVHWLARLSFYGFVLLFFICSLISFVLGFLGKIPWKDS